MITSLTGFAFIGVFFSFLAAAYRNMVAYAVKLKRVIIKDVVVENEKVNKKIIEELLNQGFEIPITSKYVYSMSKYDNVKKQCKDKISFRVLPSEKTMYRKGWQVLSITMEGDRIEYSYFRGFRKFDKLIFDTLLSEEGQESNNQHRYYYRRKTGSLDKMATGGDEECILESCSGSSFLACIEMIQPLNSKINKEDYVNSGGSKDEMIYCWGDECKEAEIEFQRWLDAEKWHKDRKIPWKRSLGLEGPPGTGKTSFVRYLGMKYGMPIISFDLSTFNNSNFTSEWQSTLRNHAPCLVLIEDIDAVFNGRKNMCNKNTLEQMLTFDCLLNSIDGVEANDGIFTVITTNHVEKLDPALLRAGRIDKMVTVGTMAEKQRRELVNKIIDHMSEKQIEKLVEDTDGMTAAEVNRRCVELALTNYWNQFDKHQCEITVS